MSSSQLPTSANGPTLLLRALRKSFADVVAVDGLDIEVIRGECFGLLGPTAPARQTTQIAILLVWLLLLFVIVLRIFHWR